MYMGHSYKHGNSKAIEATLGIYDILGRGEGGIRFQKREWAFYRELRKRGTDMAGNAETMVTVGT